MIFLLGGENTQKEGEKKVDVVEFLDPPSTLPPAAGLPWSTLVGGHSHQCFLESPFHGNKDSLTVGC